METTQALNIKEEIVESCPILFVAESSSIMTDAIGTKMSIAYGEIMTFIKEEKLEIASAPIAITRKYSIEEKKCEFEAAVPIVNLSDKLTLKGRIQKGETYAGNVLKTVHVGPYSSLHSTYNAIIAYINENGFKKNGYSWEEYIDDPRKVAQKKLKTIIYFPINKH